MEIPKNRIEKWLPHMIGLLLFMILPIFVFDSNNDRAIFWIYSYYYQLSIMIVAFYVNYLIITPHFFFNKRKVYFFAVLLLFAFTLLFASQHLYDLFQLDNLRPLKIIEGKEIPRKNALGLHPKLVDNFLLLIIVLGFSTGMANLQRLTHNKEEQKEIEKERLNTELAFLKIQISPHFFFNALNNIYALIAIDGDRAQKSVEKLSGLMRYLIYDSDIKRIELSKEFEFTRNYIELMRQRLNSKVTLDVDIQENVVNVTIPPLLFIPFIENTFKHGISYREKSFIRISLTTENNKLKFYCENSISSQSSQEPNKKGGLGITNVKKRLDLMYGDKANLKMDIHNNTFIVELVIPI
ncbi:sensor histidine kinase [Ancylomarina sp. 16SWW S1-10-2]|uniref:sensor histidine kinase n=1 Tax=Ancylomarina sp. 16SWW S1-10-2 TaxID=2499681 RepID=UPI0012AE11E4|nr:histidine kinase [Ancylomarina sp. 16SWW S1-10-2]MRT92822.1 GHKL domain-containing protein [Ancylomarina sp. 16SWW S1-10-2]